MKKDNLLLDFDGLKFDTLLQHVSYVNKHYGVESVPSDYLNNPPIHEVINKYYPSDKHVDGEFVWKDLADNFLTSIEWHKDVQPLPDMPEVIKELSKKYRLITVTARHTGGVDVIQHLLNQHAPDCVSQIHCVHEPQGNGSFKKVTKREFIESLRGNHVAFFDDAPKEIERVHDLVPSYLFDPAGLHDHRVDIKLRVRSWREIGNLLL